MTDLTEVMVQGTMKAYALHAQDKGIKVDTQQAKAAIRKAMKAGWPEFQDTIKNAREAHMGEEMYRNIMNIYCNAWAVKALKGAK
jgi:hypothetical protein